MMDMLPGYSGVDRKAWGLGMVSVTQGKGWMAGCVLWMWCCADTGSHTCHIVATRHAASHLWYPPHLCEVGAVLASCCSALIQPCSWLYSEMCVRWLLHHRTGAPAAAA
jgi:hypothetical protein